MQILNLRTSLLYVLFALIISAGLVALALPNQSSAQPQQQEGCDIRITDHPAEAVVGQTSGTYRIDIDCYQTYSFTYELYNVTDGEYIIGPRTVNDEGVYTFSNTHIFSSAGQKTITAEVIGNFPTGLYHIQGDTWSETVYTNVGDGPSLCSLDSVSISGPSDIQLPTNPVIYTANFNYTVEGVIYRFFIDGVWTGDSYITTGSSATQSIDWDSYGKGTYNVCVSAGAWNGDGNNTCSTTKSSCMNVVVDKPPLSAILRVESQNPSSGVGITRMSGNVESGVTSYNIQKNADISGELRADVLAPNGNEFSFWDGCDSTNNSGRDCVVSVNRGQTHTIRAVYNDPPTVGTARVYVASTNPSSGVGITAVAGNVYSGSTPYTIERSGDISSGTLRADRSDFVEWQGCDSVSTDGRNCVVNVLEGSSQSVTAVHQTDPINPTSAIYGCMDPNATNYDSSANTPDGSCTYASSPPDLATIHIRSDNPSTVGMGANNGNFNPSGTDYGFITPHTIQRDTALHDVVWADSVNQNNTFSHWQGCDQVYDVRGCGIRAELGQTKTITAFYDSPSSPVPVVDNFSAASDVDIDFTVTPPQIHIDDQPFTLIWNVSNANAITAQGDWNGPKSNPNGSEPRTEGPISGNAETFSYTLRAHGADGFNSATVDITVLDPPRFNLSSEPEVDIDGEPGSLATNQVTVNSYKYSGDVLLEVLNSGIPDILKDENGVSKIAFTFNPSSVDSAGNSMLTIEIIQPIYENLSETITITGTDQSGTADPEVMTTEFILISYITFNWIINHLILNHFVESSPSSCLWPIRPPFCLNILPVL